MLRSFKSIYIRRSSSLSTNEAALSQVLDSFDGPIRYAAAYGSGAFSQKGYDSKIPGKDTMVDFIFGVTHTQHFHSLNLRQNPHHYSLISNFGPSAITQLQENFGARVYYNTDVLVDGVRIKYGVVSIDDLISDLIQWDSLYLAGRLQKPVRVLRDDTRVRMASRTNSLNALRVALLLLPERFDEEELFLKIAGLSYRGIY